MPILRDTIIEALTAVSNGADVSRETDALIAKIRAALISDDALLAAEHTLPDSVAWAIRTVDMEIAIDAAVDHAFGRERPI
ncbi:MAG: hypothetical protein M3440_06675 [Chloroflexota bacterium]|nr:hypothetical protein [Chloroflexota bacterium]